MTAPNGLAQQDVIRQALRQRPGAARADRLRRGPRHRHRARRPDRGRGAGRGARRAAPTGAPPVALTAVKTNIGHLEAAAGDRRPDQGRAVPAARGDPAAPALHRARTRTSRSTARRFVHPDRAATRGRPGGRAALAGVSSFGFGGTNAHVVVEEAPGAAGAAAATDGPFAAARSRPRRRRRCATAARRLAGQLLAATADGDLGRRLLHRRASGAPTTTQRLAVVGADRGELRRAAAAVRRRRAAAGHRRRPARAGRAPAASPSCSRARARSGGPWAASCWRDAPVFRERGRALRRAAARRTSAGRCSTSWPRPEDESRLDQTEVAQPAIFAVQVGLAALWRSWGVDARRRRRPQRRRGGGRARRRRPDLDDAVRVDRPPGPADAGRHRQRHDGVGRAAAPTRWTPSSPPYGERVAVAAVNAPRRDGHLGRAPPPWTARRRPLRGGGRDRAPAAGRLRLPQPADGAARATTLAAALAGLAPAPTTVRFVSTVTGAVAAGHRARRRATGPRNVREPVRFAAAVEAAVAPAATCSSSSGPHPVLGGRHRRDAGRRSAPTVVVTCSLRRGRPERETMLPALGELYAAASPSTGPPCCPAGAVVDLPTLPVAAPAPLVRGARRQPRSAAAPTARRPPAARPPCPLGGHPRRRVRDRAQRRRRPGLPRRPPHRRHRAVLSATPSWSSARRRSTAATGRRPAGAIDDVELLAALALLPTTGTRRCRSTSRRAEAIGVRGLEPRRRRLDHARRRARCGAPPASRRRRSTSTPSGHAARARLAGDELYAELAAHGMAFGPSFRAVDDVWAGGGRPSAASSCRRRCRRHRPLPLPPGAARRRPAPVDALLPADGCDRTCRSHVAALRAGTGRRPSDLWSHVRLAGRRRATA